MYGTFNRNVDEKNRVAIPAKLRDSLGSKFYMTIGLSGVIELRSEAEYNIFAEKLLSQSQFSTNARMLQRAWLGNTQEIELDSQSRFIIPKQFLLKANIQKEVVLIGVGNLIELWAADEYENYLSSVTDEKLEEAALKLSEK
ncbi:division/cell wall cluster transcriptional repressor MraZ [Mycoplasmopsis adleri]|uniref:division/cell wall cluster transcriptional repressor MraZ n=1 Tax=Mycoplasmopsis adleri TaxID=51362 RepID=UPI003873718C